MTTQPYAARITATTRHHATPCASSLSTGHTCPCPTSATYLITFAPDMSVPCLPDQPPRLRNTTHLGATVQSGSSSFLSDGSLRDSALPIDNPSPVFSVQHSPTGLPEPPPLDDPPHRADIRPGPRRQTTTWHTTPSLPTRQSFPNPGDYSCRIISRLSDTPGLRNTPPSDDSCPRNTSQCDYSPRRTTTPHESTNLDNANPYPPTTRSRSRLLAPSDGPVRFLPEQTFSTGPLMSPPLRTSPIDRPRHVLTPRSRSLDFSYRSRPARPTTHPEAPRFASNQCDYPCRPDAGRLLNPSRFIPTSDYPAPSTTCRHADPSPLPSPQSFPTHPTRRPEAAQVVSNHPTTP